MISARRLAAAVLMAAFVALVGACGSDDGGAEADSTGTDLASAEGTMESDAESVGQSESQKPESEDEDKEKKKKAKTTSVQVTRAFRGDLVIPVVAEGRLRARHTTDIYTEITGKVVRVYANDGQAVRRGQLLVKLDDREWEAAIEESRARYLQALSLLSIEEEDLDLEEVASAIREEFSDLDKLERQGKLTREQRAAREIQLDMNAIRDGRFRYEVAAARSGVSEARAALERARINLERTEIRAPFAGVITGLTLSAGERVKVNEEICTLVDNVNIEAEVGVLEADLGHVVAGKPALLEVPALEQTIPVTVDVVSPQFDRESRTCQVLLRVQNEEGRLLPGMFVRSQIAGRTLEDRLLVPREAILTRDGRPLLFKVEDGQAKWLYVSLGESNDYLVEVAKVLQGGALEPDDPVIVSGHLTLAHDARVKIKKTLAPSDPWVTTLAQKSE